MFGVINCNMEQTTSGPLSSQSIDDDSSPVAYFACRECSEVFISDVNLKVHLLSHKDLGYPATIGCTKCDNMVVFDIKQLRQHVSTCHSSKIKDKTRSSGTHSPSILPCYQKPDINIDRPSFDEVDKEQENSSSHLKCLICSRNMMFDDLKPIEQHLDTHALTNKRFYCLLEGCDAEKDMETELNPKCGSQGRLAEYLLHIANHCISGELSKELVLLVQSVLLVILNSVSRIKPDVLRAIQKMLPGEDEEQSKVATFVHDVLSHVKVGTTKTKLRKLIRQNSLTMDKPTAFAIPTLQREDSVSGEFGGLHVARCELCDIFFQSTVEAQVHVLAHREETNPYLSCALCHQMKRYLKVDTLRQHLKCHSKENPDYFTSSTNQYQPATTDVAPTKLPAPTKILKYLNHQTQQLQKTMSEDNYHGRNHVAQFSGKGKSVRFQREMSCPEDLASSSARYENGGESLNGSGDISVESVAGGSGSGGKRMKRNDNQVFHCHECDVSFHMNDFMDFCHHLQQHTDDSKLFRCYVCKMRFVGGEMQSFVRHLCTHMVSEGQELSCGKCGAGFGAGEVDEFCGHVLQHKQLEVFQCDECEAKFPLSKDVLRHLRQGSCSNTSSVSCGLCQWKSFSNLALLVSHLASEHAEVCARCVTELFCCHWCGYSSRCLLAYQQHYLQQHATYIHVCMLCMQVFHEQLQLVEHLHTTHARSYASLKQAAASKTTTATTAGTMDACLVSVSSVVGAVYKSLTGQELYHCEACAIYCEDEQVFSAHMSRHAAAGVGDATCNLCRVELTSPQHLATHLMYGCEAPLNVAK